MMQQYQQQQSASEPSSELYGQQPGGWQQLSGNAAAVEDMQQAAQTEGSAFSILDVASTDLGCDASSSPGHGGQEGQAQAFDEQEFERQIVRAGTSAVQMCEQRIDAWKELHLASEPLTVPSEYLTLIELAVTTATGAASAGIGGAMSKAIARNLPGSGLGDDFVAAAFKDVIDANIDQAAKQGVDEFAGLFYPVVGGPARDAFFLGARTGIRIGAADAQYVVTKYARELALASADPVASAAAFADGLRECIIEAGEMQTREGVVEWLNLNAQMDLGETDMGAGADLSGMEWDNMSWREIVMGEPAYGVIRAEIVGGATEDQEYVVNGVYMAGSNPKFIDKLKELDYSLDELGLNLFVSGDVWVNVGPTSWVEFGQNDGGTLSVADRSDMSEAWLGFYSRGQYSAPPYVAPHEVEEWQEAATEARTGARMILDDLLQRTPRQLDVQHG